jgi:hypothetical protein
VADEAATAEAATFFLCCIQHLAVCLPIIVFHWAIRFVHPGTGHERPYERGTKSTPGGGACVCFFPWMWERASFKSAGTMPSKEAKVLGHCPFLSMYGQRTDLDGKSGDSAGAAALDTNPGSAAVIQEVSLSWE